MKKGMYASVTIGLMGLLALAISYPVLTQAQGGPGGPGGPGDRPRFDPEQMQQRMLDNFKNVLNTTDDEWTVIEPRLKTVFTMQMDQRMGQMGRMFGRPPGMRGDNTRGGDDNNRRPRMRGMGEPDPTVEALAQTLQDEKASAEDIKAKLDAVRADRKKKAEELNKARESLREVLTLRQEAQLVLMGILD